MQYCFLISLLFLSKGYIKVVHQKEEATRFMPRNAQKSLLLPGNLVYMTTWSFFYNF